MLQAETIPWCIKCKMKEKKANAYVGYGTDTRCKLLGGR